MTNLEKAHRVLEKKGHFPSIVDGYLYVTLGNGVDTDFQEVAIHEIEIEELAEQFDIDRQQKLNQ